MKAQKTVLAWHFVKDDGTNRDGIKEKIGQWYKVEGEIVPCQRGLHGSARPLDALECCARFNFAQDGASGDHSPAQ